MTGLVCVPSSASSFSRTSEKLDRVCFCANRLEEFSFSNDMVYTTGDRTAKVGQVTSDLFANRDPPGIKGLLSLGRSNSSTEVRRRFMGAGFTLRQRERSSDIQERLKVDPLFLLV